MGTLVTYIIQVSIIFTLLYSFHKVLLSKETFHHTNRALWLLVPILSLCLPFLDWNSFAGLFFASETVTNVSLGEFTMAAANLGETTDQNNSILSQAVSLLGVAYILGASIVLIIFAVSYTRLYLFIYRCKESTSKESMAKDAEQHNAIDYATEYVADHATDFDTLLTQVKQDLNYSGPTTLVTHSHNKSPFSWFNYIVVNENDLKENGREILSHEVAHIKEKHSIDVLLADLFIIFQWFNPISYLYKKSLMQVHEYTADDAVLRIGVNAQAYQMLLIKKAVGQRLYSMSNSLNHSNLKNRITMMLKKKSNHWAIAKCLYALPVAFFTVAAFASPEISSRFDEISQVKITTNSANSAVAEENVAVGEEINVAVGETPQKDAIPYAEVEVKPTFEGGDANKFARWVGQNLIYPTEAKDKDIQGRVVLSFIISEDGSMKDVKVLRSDHPLLGAEAVRVVSDSPKWTPGQMKGKNVAVTYFFPVIFQLREKEKEEAPMEIKEVPNYAEVDVKPTFEGGDADEFAKKWVAMKLMYPAEAKAKNIQGQVVLSFVISSNGTVQNVEVLKSAHPLLDAEAVRVVSNSPKWTPGQVNGKNVPIIMNFPVNFSIGGGEKKKEDVNNDKQEEGGITVVTY